MNCHKCKIEIKEHEEFKGKILPFIADGERKFLCETCAHNYPGRKDSMINRTSSSDLQDKSPN